MKVSSSNNFFDTPNWHLTPYQVLALGFVGLIATGTLLLMLPAAAASGEATPFVDALFTATSASCVTGLAVVDTGTHYSLFGQLVILLLIQCGGLGIMTMSTLMALLTRRKLQLRDRLIMQEALNQLTLAGIARLVKYLVALTFLIECIGGTILACRFYLDFGPQGIYYGYWHAVSAFCNAGFDVLGANRGNLLPYAGDGVVTLTLSALIICGGLGSVVYADLRTTRSFTAFSLHTKIVFYITAGLLLFGTAGFFLLEFSNPATIGNLPLHEKLLASFFQSVTSRTAGFATIPIGEMGHAALFLTMLLMFIGASPGSTGGGIKTTTFAVILASIWNQLRGNEDTVLFYRRIPPAVIQRAFTILFVSLFIVLSVTFVLDINEPPIDPGVIAFETVSAFSTTGLSMGITPELNTLSKLLLTVTMFIGRVGPVTFALALVLRRKKTKIRYPDGKVSIG